MVSYLRREGERKYKHIYIHTHTIFKLIGTLAIVKLCLNYFSSPSSYLCLNVNSVPENKYVVTPN